MRKLRFYQEAEVNSPPPWQKYFTATTKLNLIIGGERYFTLLKNKYLQKGKLGDDHNFKGIAYPQNTSLLGRRAPKTYKPRSTCETSECVTQNRLPMFKGITNKRHIPC